MILGAWNHICQNIFYLKCKKDIIHSNSWGNFIDNTTTDYSIFDGLYAMHLKNANNTETRATNYKVGKIDFNNNRENIKLELSTGASEDFKAYNIYDMAGNVHEWTTEIGFDSTGQKNGVERGSGMGSLDGSVVAAVAPNSATHYYFDVGFRVVLYLK